MGKPEVKQLEVLKGDDHGKQNDITKGRSKMKKNGVITIN